MDHFLVYRKQTEAYRHAYSTGRMKPNTISCRAYELFKEPHIAATIVEAQARLDDLTHINVAWVLKRAAMLADFNIRKFIRQDEHGNAIYDFSAATEDDWYCIDEYTVDVISKGSGGDRYDVERIKIKSATKLQALQLVGKHVNVQAFQDTLNVSGKIEVENATHTDAERGSRITALLNRARTRRTGQSDN